MYHGKEILSRLWLSVFPEKTIVKDKIGGCPSIDVPGAQTVLELSEKLKAAGTNLSFCGLSEEVRSYFDRAGVTALVGESAYFNSADQAILSLLDRELLE